MVNISIYLVSMNVFKTHTFKLKIIFTGNIANTFHLNVLPPTMDQPPSAQHSPKETEKCVTTPSKSNSTSRNKNSK